MDPTIVMSTGHDWVTSATVSLSIDYSDNVELAGPAMTLNGVNVRSQFTVSYTGSPATEAEANGSITLSPGSNTFWTEICDSSDNCVDASRGYTYDNADPTVSISPSSSYTTSNSRSVTIQWADNLSLQAGTRIVKLNGSTITSSFGWSGGGTSATSSGTVSLAPGSNILYAKICDEAGRCKSRSRTYTYDNANPGIQISPGTSTISSASTSATITWTDNLGLNAGSRVIKVNGTTVTSAFNWSGGGTFATSSDNIGLVPGQNTLYAYIKDNAGRSRSKTVTYTRPQTYTVAVTPNSGSGSTTAGDSDSFAFTVSNQGNSTATYGLSATCTGSGAAGCSPSQSSVTVGAGNAKTIFVNYGTAYGGEDVAITLEASGHGESDAGSAQIDLTYSGGEPAAPVIVAVDPRDEVYDRSSCLTIALAEAAAANCGDLRIVHGLPVMRTMNKTFAPTLIYSAVASGTAVISLGADVKLPAGAAVPDSVTAYLSVNASGFQRAKWSGAHFIPGATVRLVARRSSNATGLVPYELRVTNWYGSVPHRTIRTGTLIHVSRHASPFGSGWWLAGLESLSYVGQSRMLWIGGDGSARAYDVTADPDVWQGVNRARPDSIVRVGSQYVRMAPGGVEVVFDGSGRHIQTRDRNGITTTVSYLNGRLDRITLPTPGSTSRYYQFGYSSGKLSSVVAHGRTTQVSIGGDRVDSITDPDGTVTTFGYPSSTSRVVRFREVQGGTRTEFLVNAARHVYFVRRYLDQAPHIETRLRHQESQGVGDAGDDAPARVTELYTSIDGPRTDVADITRYHLNAYSEPDSIRDALGHWTRVLERDGDFPALVTRIRQPNGREIEAAYDNTGHVRTITDYGTQAGSTYAVTSYRWSTSCPDAPASIRNPEADSISFGYDGNCNREWQQDARGPSTRVWFQYHPDGQLAEIDPPLSASATFAHDPATGNIASITRDGVTQTFAHDTWGAVSVVTAPASDSTTRTTTTYRDAMGRDTTTIAAASDGTITTRKTYGQGGLLLSLTTETTPDPNNIGVITHTYDYDRLGRKVGEVGAGRDLSWVYDPAGNLLQGGPRPATRTYYANNWLKTEGGSAFEYDASGNLVLADNQYARVRRAYDSAGRLRTDSLWLAQFDTADGGPAGFTGGHVYVLKYGYDLNGRVTWQKAGGHLGSDSIGYGYDAYGLLEQATDRTGRAYDFLFDAESRPRRITRYLTTGSVSDTLAYDVRSRLSLRRVEASDATVFLEETPSYDAVDRLVGGSGIFRYQDIGPLKQVSYLTGGASFETDPLGNRVTSTYGVKSRRLIPSVAPHTRYFYGVGDGVLEMAEHERSDHSYALDTTYYAFNQGQRTSEERYHLLDPRNLYSDTTFWTRKTFSYYPNRLLERVTLFTDTVPRPYNQNNWYEPYQTETGYWYDALGRRILAWSWKKENCPDKNPSSGCRSTVTRTMWSGQQIAYEIRVPWTSANATSASGDHYGRVGYLHVSGIDQPIALWKGSEVVHPHLNARGAFTVATCGMDLCDPSQIDVPGDRLDPFGADTDPPPLGPPSWYGSLLTGQQDASGLLYRRNRYVDPITGTFTETDPIGIAGGLNLYGYAKGDPVSYSDPFGLCPMCVLGAAWAIYEAGSAAYDALNALRTIFSEATAGEKLTTVALAAASFGLPGGGYTAAAGRARGILREGGELIGRAGRGRGVREVTGSASDARALFGRLTEGAEIVAHPKVKGGLMANLPGGGTIGYRPISQSGPPTVDVNIPGDDRLKIKFLPDYK